MLSHRAALQLLRTLTCITLLTAFTPMMATAQVDCTGALSGEGEATYYSYTEGGNCSFGAEANPMVAAMNIAQYDGSAMCGRWVRVTGPLGSVDVKIVDMCPVCPEGDIDLNLPAFEQIAERPNGRVPITWETIPEPGTNDLGIHIRESSNPWWKQFQVRNHRYGIVSFEYLGTNGYELLPRESYNMFTWSSGTAEEGPFTLRLTDVHGQVVVVPDVPFVADATYTSSVQFPACNSATATDPISARPGVVLHRAVPNPFNPSTELSFELTQDGLVSLEIYDLSGRRVRTLVDATYAAGIHRVRWDGTDRSGASAASGVYIARVRSSGGEDQQRLVLLK